MVQSPKDGKVLTVEHDTVENGTNDNNNKNSSNNGDNFYPPPGGDTMEATTIVLIEASEFQKICGRGSKPGYYDIKSHHVPDSLKDDIPPEQWYSFQRSISRATFTIGEFCQALGLVMALMIPLFTASTAKEDINTGDLPWWVTRVLPIYLIGLVMVIALWIHRNSKLLMERRKKVVETFQSNFRNLGYSLEFVREQWDWFSFVTYVIVTKVNTNNKTTLVEEDDDNVLELL